MKKITAVFAVLGALVLGTSRAQAGNEDELVSLSHRVESITHSLSREFHAHYRHSRGYCDLQSDLESIQAKADHIHELSHDCEASLSQIQCNLRTLDAKTHHLHQVVDAIEYGRYGGHVSGDTRRVHGLLESLSHTVYAMKRTVQRLAHHSRDRDHYRGHDEHYGHSRERRGPPHPAEIIGSIFRSIHGR